MCWCCDELSIFDLFQCNYKSTSDDTDLYSLLRYDNSVAAVVRSTSLLDDAYLPNNLSVFGIRGEIHYNLLKMYTFLYAFLSNFAKRP